MKKAEFIKIVSKIEDTFEDEFRAEFNSPELIWEALIKQLTIPDVVKSLPNDEEVKAYIDTLPYYGTCTTEYNEGFEDGIKWLKGQMSK
jgi:hypothetical protein